MPYHSTNQGEMFVPFSVTPRNWCFSTRVLDYYSSVILIGRLAHVLDAIGLSNHRLRGHKIRRPRRSGVRGGVGGGGTHDDLRQKS